MSETDSKQYTDIPGTVVFDSDRATQGYYLNQFCISLRLQENREAYGADREAYIDKFAMSRAQREAALNQNWNLLLELGGNIYYTSKLAAFHGINFQELAGLMTGMGSAAYRAMMLDGGRPIDGNRFVDEWDQDNG